MLPFFPLKLINILAPGCLGFILPSLGFTLKGNSLSLCVIMYKKVSMI